MGPDVVESFRGGRLGDKVYSYKIRGTTLLVEFLRGYPPWKRRFLLETIIFRGYVSFRERILDCLRPHSLT